MKSPCRVNNDSNTKEELELLPVVDFLRDIGVFSNSLPCNSALIVLAYASDITGQKALDPLFMVPFWVYKNSRGNLIRVLNHTGKMLGVLQVNGRDLKVYGEEMLERKPGIQVISGFTCPFGYDYHRIQDEFENHYKKVGVPIYMWHR